MTHDKKLQKIEKLIEGYLLEGRALGYLVYDEKDIYKASGYLTEKIEGILKDEQPDEWPKDGDGVYVLRASGLPEWHLYQGQTYLNMCNELGNLFPTQEEAEVENDYRAAYQRCLKYIKDKGLESGNYIIVYSSERDSFIGWSESDHLLHFQDRKGFRLNAEAVSEVIENCEGDLRILWGVE